MLDVQTVLFLLFIHVYIYLILCGVSSMHKEGRYGPHGNNKSYEWEYIIIGAGPAGLQMAYFLQQRSRNYVILERDSGPGKCLEYPN